MSQNAAPGPIPSWRPGHFVWPGGRTKLVVLAGTGGRTGDAQRDFTPMMRYLAEHGGYDPTRDLLEASYAGSVVDGRWVTRPYVPADTRRPLLDSAEVVAGTLDWYRSVLPNATQFVVLGYSLGGVVALDGATMALARNQPAWRGRLPAVITLASPVRGSNAGPLISWAWLVTAEADSLGELGKDLDRRWKDPQEQERLERRAAFLRNAGTTVLTLTDPNDAIIRPEEALVPAPGQNPDDLLVTTPLVRPGSHGHGAILDEPEVWSRILETIGPQQQLSATEQAQRNVTDPLAAELDAIKARLKAQGRIR